MEKRVSMEPNTLRSIREAVADMRRECSELLSGEQFGADAAFYLDGLDQIRQAALSASRDVKSNGHNGDMY